MSTEQQYYELLARTDHPVYARDFSTVTTKDSPFNSIMNRVIAKQLFKFKQDLDAVAKNSFPNTCDELSIDQWEETCFGFTKPTELLADRIAALLIKINTRIGMKVSDVIAAAQAITGMTPIVIRNLYFSGWILGQGILDISTIFSSGNQATDAQRYLVVFSAPVDGFLLKKLDDELTKIEKGGSTHVIVAPPNYWTLDRNKLSVDTILR